MKTMQDYMQYCTEEQTRRAHELGAPIEIVDFILDYENTEFFEFRGMYVIIPTTQQMIGWLKEKGFYFDIFNSKHTISVLYDVNNVYLIDIRMHCATIHTAIDAALDYLENRNKI